MKILHTADLHLGQIIYQNYDRSDEHRYFFSQLERWCREERPDALVVSGDVFNPERDSILRQIELQLQPDTLVVEDDLAFIAVVGEGMLYSRGTSALLFGALAEAGVNIRMIDQGSSELNIIIGVSGAEYETALRALYRAAFEEM